MKKSHILRDLTEQLCAAIPKNVVTLKKDMEKNFHAILQRAFGKLDLVTRQEFDVQTKVLARSRKKVEALEEKLKEIEKKLKRK